MHDVDTEVGIVVWVDGLESTVWEGCSINNRGVVVLASMSMTSWSRKTSSSWEVIAEFSCST